MRSSFWLVALALLAACSSSPAPKPLDLTGWPRGPISGAKSPEFEALLGLVEKGELPLALARVEQALELQPEEPNLYRLKAKILLTLGRKTEALDFLTTKMEERPDLVELRAVRGLILKELGHRESAKDDLLWVASSSRSKELYVALTDLMEGERAFGEAVNFLAEALKIDPTDPSLWFKKAQLEMQLGRLQGAALSILEARKLAPGEVAYQQFYIDFLAYTGQKSSLGRQLEILVETFPREPWFAIRLAAFEIEQAELAKAKTTLLTSLKLNPDDPLLHFQIATILSAEKLYPEAKEHFLKGLSLKPESTLAMVQIAKIELMSARIEEAVKYLEQARTQGSEDLFVYRALGKIYNERRDSYEAERAILEGLTLAPEDVQLLIEFGTLLERRHKNSQAILAYEEAVKQQPNNGYLLAKLGNLYRLERQYSKATAYLTKAAQKDTDSIWIKAQMIELYTDTEAYDLALAGIADLVQVNPDDYWPYAKRALILMAQEKFPEAEQNIEWANQRNPQAPWLKELEGQVLSRLGRYEESVKAFEAALAANPDNAFVLTRMAYAALHVDVEKSKAAVAQALDLEDFEVSGLELYLYLNGKSAETWGFGPNSAEAEIYGLIINKKHPEAQARLAKLESPYKPYLAFFNQILLEGPRAKLSVYRPQPLTSGPGWFGFYQAAQALFDKNEAATLAHLEAANRLSPDNPWIQARLAYSYELAERHAEAVTLLEAHLKARPQSLWAKLRLALNYDMAGNPKASEKMYLEILAQKPQEHIALNNLAWLYATTKDRDLQKLDQAQKMSEKAVEISPSSANLDTLAEIFYLKKDYKRALMTIDRALDQDRESLDYFKKQKKKILKALAKRP